MGVRSTMRAVLAATGMLGPARHVMTRIRRSQRHRYYERLMREYRHPFARPIESFAAYEQRERDAAALSAQSRYRADQQAIMAFALGRFGADEADLRASLVARYRTTGDSLAEAHAATIVRALSSITGSSFDAGQRGTGVASLATFDEDRSALLDAILRQVVDPRLSPSFYDYDYIDDIVDIVGGRYCTDDGCDLAASRSFLEALAVLAGVDPTTDARSLSAAVRGALGAGRAFVPRRGDVTQHVRNVIPEMADEFINLKAETNVSRFLEINLEYSRRQATEVGAWDIRELSLLRGYERDHHLLLRTLLRLLDDGELQRDDEVLLIGPRHIDEVVFFRKSLGLRRTIGLDLFEVKDKIVVGDMHRMPFASGRFKLVYSCNTFSYSYNVRRVVEEVARVTTRPGYFFIIDSGNRKTGPDALGRSDLSNVDALIGLFHRHPFRVLAKDPGRSLAPHMYENQPCLALRFETRRNGAKVDLKEGEQ